MSVNISTSTLNNIYNNSFQKYLTNSETIQGHIYEQSTIVNNVFKSTLELVHNFHKYKRSLNPLAEQYLTDPLIQEIAKVKSFEAKASDHIFQVTLISKSIKVFEWVQENDVEKFVSKLNKYVQFYQQKAQSEIESLGKIHFEWLKSWNETYEEFSVFIINFYKNGIVWSGNVALPLPSSLGDSQVVQKTFEHKALLNEINQGETIQSILHPHQNFDETAVFEKTDQKWLIKHQKDNHKGLVVNTAKKEDYIFIYNCEDCTVVIENVINSIRIDLCKKITVLFRNTIKVETADCRDCNLHCFEKIVSLDMTSCENVGLYLSDKSLDTRIATTKCCGITVNFPFEDGLYQNFRISDQLITKIVPNKGIETMINKV